MATHDVGVTSRRAVLRAAGAAGFLGTGTARGNSGERPLWSPHCPDATKEPATEHYTSAGTGACADDHPATRDIQTAVSDSLRERYPTVGALLDEGYVPYFDFATTDGEDGWSHWLNPEFIGDDAIVDPERPEAVLVDHRWWRPIGVMFIATQAGDRVDPPPAVYRNEEAGRCVPWHTHVGLPGRYAWWKYRLLYAEPSLRETGRLPCDTPWVMHVWAYPHPESVYAHDAPPPENRGGPPAEPAGFETDAVPGEDALGPEVVRGLLSKRAERLLDAGRG